MVVFPSPQWGATRGRSYRLRAFLHRSDDVLDLCLGEGGDVRATYV